MFVSGKCSTNLYVKRTCFAEIMALNESLISGMYTFYLYFHIPWKRCAVKRFVITTSVNQNLKTNNKFQAANRFGKMT